MVSNSKNCDSFHVNNMDIISWFINFKDYLDNNFYRLFHHNTQISKEDLILNQNYFNRLSSSLTLKYKYI